MSNHVASLVYKRKIGSSTRKTILAYCADKASDDGSGIWASKGTIAAETECARSTVIKTLKDFVEEGLMVVCGQRSCSNGATIEYAIDLQAVAALPPADVPRTNRPAPNPSASRTRSNTDGSANRTPPVRQTDPMVSARRTQTTLEPSFNHGGGGSARESEAANGSITEPRELLLEAMGADPVSGMFGPNGRRLGTEVDMAAARRWSSDLGLTLSQQLAVIAETMARKSDGPPSSFTFFDKPMARRAGELQRLASQPLSPDQPTTRTGGSRHDRNSSFSAKLRQVADTIRADDADR